VCTREGRRAATPNDPCLPRSPLPQWRPPTLVKTSASASWCSGRSSAASSVAHRPTASGRGSRANLSDTPRATRLAATGEGVDGRGKRWSGRPAGSRFRGAAWLLHASRAQQLPDSAVTPRRGAAAALTVRHARRQQRLHDGALDALLPLELAHDPVIQQLQHQRDAHKVVGRERRQVGRELELRRVDLRRVVGAGMGR
jgi:hypothetical protein